MEQLFAAILPPAVASYRLMLQIDTGQFRRLEIHGLCDPMRQMNPLYNTSRATRPKSNREKG
jgi:hypothetical protein